MQTMIPACDTCLNESCCAEITTCAANPACVALVECVATNCFDDPDGVTSCATAPINMGGCDALNNPAVGDALPIVTCAQGNCAADCGI
jgi:hypothetical protein